MKHKNSRRYVDKNMIKVMFMRMNIGESKLVIVKGSKSFENDIEIRPRYFQQI